jgi:hypothetical protein
MAVRQKAQSANIHRVIGNFEGVSIADFYCFKNTYQARIRFHFMRPVLSYFLLHPPNFLSLPFSVSRYFWKRLLGCSEMVAEAWDDTAAAPPDFDSRLSSAIRGLFQNGRGLPLLQQN